MPQLCQHAVAQGQECDSVWAVLGSGLRVPADFFFEMSETGSTQLAGRNRRALSHWLVFVACLRLLSVYIGYFDVNRFKTALIDLRPDYVNPLLGRLFASWTLLTCGLCLICAKNPFNRAVYGATLLSFIAALVHFALELFVFKTSSFRGVLTPSIVAGLSTTWMGLGWMQARTEPAQHHNVTALRRWLQLVAVLKLFSVGYGISQPGDYTAELVDLASHQVTPLYSRLFIVWTFVQCAVLLLCSSNPTDAGIYGAALLAFSISLGSTLLEVFVFHTVSLKSAASSLAVAGLSTAFMAMGWNYYTKYCKQLQAEEGKKGPSSHPLLVDGKEEEDGPSEISALKKED